MNATCTYDRTEGYCNSEQSTHSIHLSSSLKKPLLIRIRSIVPGGSSEGRRWIESELQYTCEWKHPGSVPYAGALDPPVHEEQDRRGRGERDETFERHASLETRENDL